jgi:hypothetical protein
MEFLGFCLQVCRTWSTLSFLSPMPFREMSFSTLPVCLSSYHFLAPFWWGGAVPYSRLNSHSTGTGALNFVYHDNLSSAVWWPLYGSHIRHNQSHCPLTKDVMLTHFVSETFGWWLHCKCHYHHVCFSSKGAVVTKIGVFFLKDLYE